MRLDDWACGCRPIRDHASTPLESKPGSAAHQTANHWTKHVPGSIVLSHPHFSGTTPSEPLDRHLSNTMSSRAAVHAGYRRHDRCSGHPAPGGDPGIIPHVRVVVLAAVEDIGWHLVAVQLALAIAVGSAPPFHVAQRPCGLPVVLGRGHLHGEAHSVRYAGQRLVCHSLPRQIELDLHLHPNWMPAGLAALQECEPCWSIVANDQSVG